MFLCQAVYRFFDSSNCHTVCVFCLVVCPPNRTGPDRISMEVPKRWKKLKLREPTLSSRRLRGKQQQPTVKAAPAKREAHIELEEAPAKSSKMLRGKQAATTTVKHRQRRPMSARHRRLASLGPAQSMSILQNCYAACSWMTVPLMDHQMILWQQHQPVGAATDRAFLRKRRLDDDCCDGVYKQTTHTHGPGTCKHT